MSEKESMIWINSIQFKLVFYGKYEADGTNTDADYETADAGEYSIFWKKNLKRTYNVAMNGQLQFLCHLQYFVFLQYKIRNKAFP